MPGKVLGKGNGRLDGNGRTGAEARDTLPDQDLVLVWPGPRKVVSLLKMGLHFHALLDLMGADLQVSERKESAFE